MKREGPVGVAFLTGVIVLLAYFFKNSLFSAASGAVLRWRVVVAAFTLVLGGYNMIRVHLKRIADKHENWPYSLVFLVSFVVLFTTGVLTSSNSAPYQYVWRNVYQPAAATMYTFTLFYMTSACWRAFRIRNWQAALLMATGAIVILGQVGIGDAISPAIPAFSSWIISNINAAGIRAITIGGSLGMVMVSVRVILGLERSYMPGEGD